MLGDQSSLVKYSTPVLVSAGKALQTKKSSKKQEQAHHTQDILGEILPPKQHRTDNGQLWVQTVLSTPATKIQVIQLQQQMDKKLIQKQAKEVGICPVRQQLYDQCFDEIIRQITIDCRQRGLLLVRVRDQYKNQIKAYKRLYESSISHGMRRVIQSEDKKSSMAAEIQKLQRQCQDLQKNVTDLHNKIQTTKDNDNKKLKEQAEKHKKQMDQIRETNQKLKTQIQNAIEKKI